MKKALRIMFVVIALLAAMTMAQAASGGACNGAWLVYDCPY